ncbi:LOW QUALITY PROTEIN: target of rapamycin complex 2 subunit MAPKAP1-like [Pecten maximus]|uniref:LOW QUALITY PROTEIN: target of rapamycin complex 2 subunit MAPKAP1-like n=1 Tax=Pecten maximus TaxID=6579 RepID=UPI0014588916|nr:LOW QUALITY PROTEIN: target of rapamycin complex 2 subunit MAPKAP1-like [Pecten maximus]
MAMMDDAGFLITHIRNCFITSDDTGMCEIVLETDENDNFERKQPSKSDPSSADDSGMESSDMELSSGSYDIMPDMGYPGHRLRSNTAQRLERMKKEKRSQRKVKNIPWRDAAVNYNVEDRGHLFEKKSLSENAESPISIPKQSKLTEQLEMSSSDTDNPFLDYLKFDGRASAGVHSRKIDIFLTMAGPADRPYPMPVVCVVTAKIQELIGLICWQYTNEGRDPKLNENIEMYSLHIAEDDGEVDMDFPSLDPREPVSKFGFAKLALVEKNIPTQTLSKASLVVTVYVPHRGFNKFQMEGMDIPMKDILQRVLKRRKVKIRPGQSYNLEKQTEPGVAVDLDATLANMDTMEFCLVRQHSTRGEEVQEEEGDMSGMAESLTSHQYKSYIVSLVHKLRANTEVQLGVSGEKVEIDPVASKGTLRIFRQKAVTYDADSIASCDIIEEKVTGKCIFRLTHLSNHDYKHHDFEAESEVAMEIVSKLKNILELRISPARKEYMAAQTRKLLKKRDSLKFTSLS